MTGLYPIVSGYEKNGNMERPRIKIKKTSVDFATEIVGIIGLLLLIGLPLYYFEKLPETIPRHFGANGEADGFSGKGIIWTLPIIGMVMYVGMFWLNKYPHIFNYPQQVTKENAERLYTIGTRMIRTLNSIITCIFAYITYSTIQTSLGNQDGLGTWFTPVFVILIFGVTGYFLYQSMSKKSQTANNV